MKIVWHNKARNDLNLNIKYIAKSSPQNAMKVLNELVAFVDSLLIFPNKYPKEPIYNAENIRFVTKWSYKIIYRVDAEIIYILRIFNTNQNPKDIKLSNKNE